MINTLTQTGFDKFLATLDAEREQAGLKYEALRRRLIKFFEWRDCESAEELTDTTIDRIVRKITEGEEIKNINAYSATVAQFVLKEYRRNLERQNQLDEEKAAANFAVEHAEFAAFDGQNERENCFEQCLTKMDETDKKLLVAYHDADEKTMIATRRRLADSLEISLNVLRIRVCRLKTKLENCTVKCCGKT